MKGFFTQLRIQWKINAREKGFLMYFYFLPLIVYIATGTVMRLLKVGDSSSIVASMTICLISIGAYLGVPKVLWEAREFGIMKAYRAGGIPFWSLPLINIVISLIHIMITAIIILITAPLVFAANWPQSIPAHLINVMIIALSSLAYGTLLSSLIKNQIALKIAGFGLVLLTVLYNGVVFTSDLLPKIIKYVCELVPFTHGIRLLKNTGSSFGSFFLLILMTAATLFASYLLYNRVSKNA